MSSFIKLSTLEYPRHEGDIRLEYPNILETETGETFPCPETYAKVIENNRPIYNYQTQKCVEMTPQYVDGVWVQTWKIVDLTEEEKQQNSYFQTNLDSVAGGVPNVIG